MEDDGTPAKVRPNDGLGVATKREELMASQMKFKCPKCGDFRWGTSNCTKPKSEWMGHCHGYKDGRPCGLSWHRETQDSEVMHEEDVPDYMLPNAESTGTRRAAGP